MESVRLKKSIIQALEAILDDLTVADIEDLQDKLSVQLHKLMDDGKRYSLNDVKQHLSMVNESNETIEKRQ